MQRIVLKKVKGHNLKEVSLTLEPNQLICFTGVSGSGKSSLAFDTIYAEGQRRYIESLSTYARRHLKDLPRPDAELISGISPTIAIEQKSSGNSPRSTVGTMTGIYDYLRVLFARCATPHCPESGEPIVPQSPVEIMEAIGKLDPKKKLILLSPLVREKKGSFKDLFADLLRQGFTRARVDGKWVELEEAPSLDKEASHTIEVVIDRLTSRDRDRIKEGVTLALEKGSGLMSVCDAATDEVFLFSQHAYAKKSGKSYPKLEPHDFSFNHPLGMCEACQGLGTVREFDLAKVVDPNLSIKEDCCLVAPSYETVRYGNIYDNLARLYGFKVTTPWKDLKERAKEVFLYGTENKWTQMRFVHPVKKTAWNDYVQWRGALFEAKERYAKAKHEKYLEKMESLQTLSICSSCHGSRLRPYPSAAKFHGLKIYEITALSVNRAQEFFAAAPLDTVSEELIKEIRERLTFLTGVGLHYLTLDRISPTLSGGESQRVRLASQIGSGLVGTTYILDEPSIGLHPKDNLQLLATLRALQEKGNTVIVIEHDEETIREADIVVDIGPLAGKEGGEIISAGSLEELLANPRSITGAYLSGRRSIPIPKKRKRQDAEITIYGACHHNLKELTVSFPLGLFITVVGVSGSGKSSLIEGTLYPAIANTLHGSELSVGKHEKIRGLQHIDKVIAIDQSPIGRTPRSNPATYTHLFDEIRTLFSELPESLASGYDKGRFSFNVKEGSCPHCQGMGFQKLDMDFLEDEWQVCEYCEGRRFDEKTLSVLFKGKNIHDVLEMTVEEALAFFEAIPQIRSKLEGLSRVGLGYIKLGQSSPTLSGGEAQRIKLAKELARPSTGKTLYLLDEPTTGLHFHDISNLVAILQSLVDKGNTVLVIEHNLDLIRASDWIIELGIDGGDEGGKLIAEGAPDHFLKLETPTALALKHPTREVHKSKTARSSATTQITVKGASQNTLKGVDATIPRGKITVCTGPSGSGKTSFAFETLYAEGQRRYSESLSPYARQFIKQMPKPKVEMIEGLSAAIAIEQKSHAGNPRSTVGTMTESYDFLRLLYAYLGVAHAPETGNPLTQITAEKVAQKILSMEGKAIILAPLTLKKGESIEELELRLQKSGYLRLRLNGLYYELEETIPFDPKAKNELYLVIDRVVVSRESEKRLLEAIEVAARFSSGLLVIENNSQDTLFNLAFSDPETGRSYPPLTPHSFSFNTEHGMCRECLGIGLQYTLDLSRDPEVMSLTPPALIQYLWRELATVEALSFFKEITERMGLGSRLPLHKQKPEPLSLFLNGPFTFRHFTWQGVNKTLAHLAKKNSALKEALEPLLSEHLCPACKGERLSPLARHVTLQGLTLPQLCALPVFEALAFLKTLSPPDFLEEAKNQLISRLTFLEEIGLGYLSLARSAPTLSGGESQRIHLSRQLGSSLTGCLYVLDEPTIGLHPHDNHLLNSALEKLRDLGNTLVLVEHDPLTILRADYLIDFGPGAGKGGGTITARGTLAEILRNPNSLTGAYLSGKKSVPTQRARRQAKGELIIEHASANNLKDLTLRLPLGTLLCLTGVSGSGKSTLLHSVIRPRLEQEFESVLVLHQSPIGRTVRADISTYTDLAAPLRKLFASFPQALAKGLQPKHFSANHKRGMCPSCWGLGVRSVPLQFLPPVKLTCEACSGYRLNPLSLTVTYKEKNFGQILELTVEEARVLLDPFPKIVRHLDTLISVGLGYLQLGQEIATLSGGEQQRLRLTRELSKRPRGKTAYLFDEPSTGLHSEDLVKLVNIFHALVDKGSSVILIEHNIDLIKNADYLIDLGPGAGAAGGEVVAVGTPEEVAKNPRSLTGRYL